MPELSLTEMEAVYLKKEWVIDPAPWIAAKLDVSVLQEIYRVKLDALAQVTELEIQAKQIEQNMYRQIAKALG